jgi:hypothetical protein
LLPQKLCRKMRGWGREEKGGGEEEEEEEGNEVQFK